jgi:hypothetical protein
MVAIADSSHQTQPNTSPKHIIDAFCKTSTRQFNLHNPPKMSGAAQGSSNTTKAVTSDPKDTSQPLQPQKPGAQLEEDDEFEDFPVEGMYTPLNQP